MSTVQFYIVDHCRIYISSLFWTHASHRLSTVHQVRQAIVPTGDQSFAVASSSSSSLSPYTVRAVLEKSHSLSVTVSCFASAIRLNAFQHTPYEKLNLSTGKFDSNWIVISPKGTVATTTGTQMSQVTRLLSNIYARRVSWQLA